MAFQKGNPRPPNAGRKPGSKNKKTIIGAYDVLANRDKNPVEEILNIVDSLPPWDQINAWFKLLEWIEPKAKVREGAEDDSDSDAELISKFKNTPVSDILKILNDDEVV